VKLNLSLKPYALKHSLPILYTKRYILVLNQHTLERQNVPVYLLYGFGYVFGAYASGVLRHMGNKRLISASSRCSLPITKAMIQPAAVPLPISTAYIFVVIYCSIMCTALLLYSVICKVLNCERQIFVMSFSFLSNFAPRLMTLNC